MTVDELIIRLRCASDAGHGSDAVLLGGPDAPLQAMSSIEFVLDVTPEGHQQQGVLLR